LKHLAGFERVVEGHGFSRAARSRNSEAALAAGIAES